MTQSTLEETYNALLAKKEQINALEIQIRTAKENLENNRSKKKQEFVAMMKKIPTVKLNQVHPEIRTLQKILKQV